MMEMEKFSRGSELRKVILNLHIAIAGASITADGTSPDVQPQYVSIGKSIINYLADEKSKIHRIVEPTEEIKEMVETAKCSFPELESVIPLSGLLNRYSMYIPHY